MQKDIYIWGTGKQSEKLISMFEVEILECGVKGFIDNDSSKIGTRFHSWDVFSPSILHEHNHASILINTVYKEEIREQIESMKFFKGGVLDDRFF